MRTLLIILLILFIISRLLRYMMPYILRRVQRKMEERMRGFSERAQENQRDQSVQEGETVVVSKPNNTSQAKTDEIGDYVEFEEIEE